MIVAEADSLQAGCISNGGAATALPRGHYLKITPLRGEPYTIDLASDGAKSEFVVSQPEPSPSRPRSELMLSILQVVTQQPGLDDVEIADHLGEIPFEVAVCLRELESRGLIEENVSE